MVAPLTELHAPYTALLRAALDWASPKEPVQSVLDLGCGPGLKTAWLAEHGEPGGHVIGVDLNRGCFTQPMSNDAPTWLVADAHSLPLATASVNLIWCVATYPCFQQPATVLAEVRRILRPQGRFVLASAYQLWVRPRQWPQVVYDAWAFPPPTPGDGLGAALLAELQQAGLQVATWNAYLLDPPTAQPLEAALALASWDDLAPQVAAILTPEECAACRAAEEVAEPEVRSILLVVVGQCYNPPHEAKTQL